MKTVLAIDDDKITLGLLASQLGSLGFKVITEKDSVKGVEFAKEFSPDLILLDLNMPQMNGFEVMRSLRKDRLTREIPVIILSVNKDRETVIDAMKSGAIDYIVKPYVPDRLSRKIVSAINYGDSRKYMNTDSFIEISHKGDSGLVIMRRGIMDRQFQENLKTVFNPFFMKQIHGKVCIFDIREMNDFNDNDVMEFLRILTMFSGSKIKIVTGKHYGEIVSCADIDENMELFLSFGDLDHAMNKN